MVTQDTKNCKCPIFEFFVSFPITPIKQHNVWINRKYCLYNLQWHVFYMYRYNSIFQKTFLINGYSTDLSFIVLNMFLNIWAPGTHFVKHFMTSWFKSCKTICSGSDQNGPIRSQICTYHGSSAVILCAELGRNMIMFSTQEQYIFIQHLHYYLINIREMGVWTIPTGAADIIGMNPQVNQYAV